MPTTKADLIAVAKEYERLHMGAKAATAGGDPGAFKLNSDRLQAARKLIDVALEMDVPPSFPQPPRHL